MWSIHTFRRNDVYSFPQIVAWKCVQPVDLTRLSSIYWLLLLTIKIILKKSTGQQHQQQKNYTDTALSTWVMWIFLIVFIIGIITREGDLSSSPAVCYHLLTDPRNSRRNSAPGRQQWIGPQNANYHLPMWKMSFGTFQGTWIESFSSCGLDLRRTRGLGLGSRRKKKRFMAAILEMREQRGRTSSRLFCTIKLFFF
jgi:hypothetical protein